MRLWAFTRPWWWPWHLLCESYDAPERHAERRDLAVMPSRRAVPARQPLAIPARQVHVITDARPSRAIERRQP